MKKALLLGSSFSAVPLLNRLKRRGIYVAVAGNQPDDPCHEYADASFAINYADPQQLLSVLENNGFDYLVPSCNDFAYLSGTEVANLIGFPGYDSVETAAILHQKDLFRQFTTRHEYAVPAYVKLGSNNSTESPIGYPCLIKPVDSFSGRGVSKVSSAQVWAEALQNAQAASRSCEVIVEQFVEGNLYSHSAFIRDGQIVVDSFVDEFCTVYAYQVNCSNHPSRLSEHHQALIRAQINRLITHLQLADGLLHTQFIANAEQVYLIECMRRCPGDLFGILIEKSIGLDYMDMYLQPFVGEVMSRPALSAPKYISRHTISVNIPKACFSVTHHMPAISVDYVPLKESGHRLGVAPFDKLGIVFAEHFDQKQLFELTPQWADFIEINTHASL